MTHENATTPKPRIRRRVRPPVRSNSLKSVSLETLPVADIKPYQNNPRKHPPEHITKLENSISEFGVTVPVLIDADNVIIAGHARFQAMGNLGIAEIPVLRVEHLTDAQIKAYRIADNKLAEGSDWDEGLLRVEITDLIELEMEDALNFDLGVLGFETSELDILLSDSPTSDQRDEADEFEEAGKEPPRARKGDIWQLGRHRLLCGSALEHPDYARLMDGEAVMMVFTDPPYNVPVNGHVRNGKAGHREFAMASGEQSTAEFTQFLTTSLDHMVANSEPGAILFVCMDWRHLPELHAASVASELEQRNLVVWNKTNAGMGSLYRSQHELVAVYRKKGRGHVNNVQLGRFGRNRTNVWTYAGVNSFGRNRDADLADHPTVKPVAMVEDAIRDVTHRGDLVLDPFGGSGTTLLAAERCGRRARLIEIDPAYVDVTIRRWEALTGQEAVELTTGDAFQDRLQAATVEA